MSAFCDCEKFCSCVTETVKSVRCPVPQSSQRQTKKIGVPRIMASMEKDSEELRQTLIGQSEQEDDGRRYSGFFAVPKDDQAAARGERFLRAFQSLPGYKEERKNCFVMRDANFGELCKLAMDIGNNKPRKPAKPVLESAASTEVSPAKMTKSEIKKARKEQLAREAVEVARGTSESTAPVSEEKSLPEHVRCGLCQKNIQPKAEKYLRFTCGEDQVVCSFPCHKECISKHYNGPKKLWKGQPCPTEACEENLLVVYLVDKNLDETVLIKSDGKKTKTEVQDKKAVKEVKKPEKKRSDPRVVTAKSTTLSPKSTSRSSSKNPFQGEIAVPSEKKMDQQLLVSFDQTRPSVKSAQTALRIPTDDEVVIPLQKEKDQAEEKYSVPPPAKIIRTKTKHQKVVLPVAFESSTCHDGFRTSMHLSTGTEVLCPIERRVKFPKPGTRDSMDYQDSIIVSLRSIIDDLPANLPEYDPDETHSVTSLLYTLLKLTDAYEEKLSPGQLAYIKELLKISKSCGKSKEGYELRNFVLGLDHYFVGYCFKKKSWQYHFRPKRDYRNLLGKKQLKIFENALEIDECPICIEEMAAYHRQEKCCHCSRLFHAECIEKWHKTKRDCPICRRLMVNDSDFPAI